MSNTAQSCTIIQIFGFIFGIVYHIHYPQLSYPVSAAFTEFSKQGIGQQAACSIVFIIPLLILFILYKDNLIEGIEKSVVGSSKR